jgi:hypothetical protein
MSIPTDDADGPDPIGSELAPLLASLNAPVVGAPERAVTGPPPRRPGAGAPEPAVGSGDQDPGPDDTAALRQAKSSSGPAPAPPAAARGSLPRTFGRTRRQSGPRLTTSAALPEHLLRELQRRRLEERYAGRQLIVDRYINDAVRALPVRAADVFRDLNDHADELNIGRGQRDEGWRQMTSKGIRLDADASTHLDKIILAFYDKYDEQLTRSQLIGLALVRALRS